MAIDEKKAILRGLTATAQQMREEAASPEAVAKVEANRRSSDRRYRTITGPVLLLPLGLAFLAVGWQEYRFYDFGMHWGSAVSAQRYFREAVELIGAGLLLCGAGFALLWLFREVCSKPMRIAGMIGNIIAAVISLVGVFFFGLCFTAGRNAAYARLNFAELVAAAPEVERIRNAGVGLVPGVMLDETGPEWAHLPQVIKDVHAPHVIVLDHGYALDLDDAGGPFGSSEGLIIPQEMSQGMGEQRARQYKMELVSNQPPVLRYKDLETPSSGFGRGMPVAPPPPGAPGAGVPGFAPPPSKGEWLNGVLDGTSQPMVIDW